VRGRRLTSLLAAYGMMGALACALGALWGRPVPLWHPAPRGELDDHADLVSLVLGVVAAVATIVATRVFLDRTAWAKALRTELRTALRGGSGEGPSGLSLILLGVLSGLSEELLFRGALQPVCGFWITSIGFGLLHVGPSRTFLPWTVWAIVMGLILGAMFEWTGSLLGPIVAHATINAVNLRTVAEHDARFDEGGDGRLAPPRLVAKRPPRGHGGG
jgi:membrane protease YdiL (CAAX protease family)